MATERKKQQDRERMQRKRNEDALYTNMIENRLRSAEEILSKFMEFRDSDYVPNNLFEIANSHINGERRSEGNEG